MAIELWRQQMQISISCFLWKGSEEKKNVIDDGFASVDRKNTVIPRLTTVAGSESWVDFHGDDAALLQHRSCSRHCRNACSGSGVVDRREEVADFVDTSHFAIVWPVVNFTNILRAAFVPIFFCQNITYKAKF